MIQAGQVWTETPEGTGEGESGLIQKTQKPGDLRGLPRD